MSLLKYLPQSLKEKIRARAGAVTEEARLRNLYHAGFRPTQIIDGGAYQGSWATLIHDIFNDAELLLIEPQTGQHPHLMQLCHTMPHCRLSTKAIGAESGQAHFFQQHSNSRIVTTGKTHPLSDCSQIQVDTLENIAREHHFHSPDLIKLDLQGHEYAALQGVGGLCGTVELFIIETTWLPVGNATLVNDVISFMHARGYQLYDVFGLNHRPLDNALWQSDFIFVLKSSALVANHDWQ